MRSKPKALPEHTCSTYLFDVNVPDPMLGDFPNHLLSDSFCCSFFFFFAFRFLILIFFCDFHSRLPFFFFYFYFSAFFFFISSYCFSILHSFLSAFFFVCLLNALIWCFHPVFRLPWLQQYLGCHSLTLAIPYKSRAWTPLLVPDRCYFVLNFFIFLPLTFHMTFLNPFRILNPYFDMLNFSVL